MNLLMQYFVIYLFYVLNQKIIPKFLLILKTKYKYFYYRSLSNKDLLFLLRIGDLYYLKIYPKKCLENPKNYTISSCSIYKNKEAKVTAGNTRPTKGTKIEGR